MKFRKKPVEVDAIPVRAVLDAHSPSALPGWLREKRAHGAVVIFGDHVSIQTLEGTMTAYPADWIIRGVQGEVYPCKPDIFAATYERVVEG